MKQLNINQINESNKKKRYAVDSIKDFFATNKERSGKIVVLYGLRRTGKTTIMNQVIDDYKNTIKCAFYEIETNDKMDNIYDMLVDERDKGTKLICIDEITNAKDFIENSAILADIFAKEGMKIIITGTESLGFYFAEDKSLFDRTFRIRTTHISYAEHSEVLGTNDIDDYIKYGGLMREGLKESAIYDYLSAKQYLDSSVSDNIISNIHKDWHNNSLKDMEAKELKAIIAKMVEIYSGVFNKTQMQSQLEKVSVNAPLDLLYESKYADYIKLISHNKRNIAEDFTKIINADIAIKTKITDDIVLTLENYLIDMDVLSATKKMTFSYTDDLGWIEQPTKDEFYIIQPAIKYFHLKKGLEFIENEKYYIDLPQDLKNLLRNKLDEKIKGDMIEQIIAFDIAKSLDREKYSIFKSDFFINGNKVGEYDLLVYNNESNSYFAFEIKHTSNPNEYQSKHLQNEKIKEIVDKKFGNRMAVAILYRGESFITENNTIYFNISDFLIAVNKHKNMEAAIQNLNTLTNEETKETNKPRKPGR